jgi:thiol-disulfide isomerase/thioredoxin
MQKLFLITLTVIALGLGLSLIARGDDSDTNSLVGKAAPEIALKTLDGQDFTLSDQKGKVVVLDFWATWCPPCRASLPHVQSVSQDKALAAKNVIVCAVNERESADDVNKFLQDNHYTFKVAMDASGSAGSGYKVTGIPTTVIVGTDGIIKNVFIGFGDDSAKQIDDAIQQVVGS